jgi:MFS family permease
MPQTLQSPRRFKIPPTIWVLGIISFLTDFGSEMVTSILPLFLVQELGSSASDVGWIEGIAEATAAISKVFSGVFSDWVGQRKMLILLGYGLAAAVKPLIFLSTSAPQILAARFLDRIGKGIRVAPRDALVADAVTPETRGAAYGLRQTLDTAGAFLGPVVAFGLLLLYPGQFRWVFALACIPGLLAVLAIIFKLRDAPMAGPRTQFSLQGWQQLPPSFWRLMLTVGVFTLGNSSEAFMILRAQNLGIGLAVIPLTIVVMNLGYLLSSYPVGVLSDRIGRRGLLQLGWLLYGLIYAGYAVVQAQWQVWLLFALYGLYLGLTQGVLKAMVAEVAPSHLRGSCFGVFNLVTGFMLLPASVLAGWLWQAFAPGTPFSVGAGLAFMAVLGLQFSPRPTRPDGVL